MGIFSFLKKVLVNNVDTNHFSSEITSEQYAQLRSFEEKWLEEHFDFNSSAKA